VVSISLEQIEVHETIWQMPKQKHISAKDYVQKYGDYQCNQRGDRPVTGPNGEDLMLLAGEQVWTKITRIVEQALKRRKLNDPNDDIGGAFLEQRWKHLKGHVEEAGAKRGALAKSKAKAKAAKAKAGEDDAEDELGLNDMDGNVLAGSSKDEVEGSDTFFDSKCAAIIAPEQEVISKSSKKSVASPKDDGKTTKGKKSEGRQPKQKSEKQNLGRNKDDVDKSQKKAGRPSLNRSVLLQQGLHQLKETEEGNPKFFGQEWKTSTRRNWDECRSSEVVLHHGPLLLLSFAGISKMLPTVLKSRVMRWS